MSGSNLPTSRLPNNNKRVKDDSDRRARLWRIDRPCQAGCRLSSPPSHNGWLSGLPCVVEIVTASFRGVLAAYDMSRRAPFFTKWRFRRCRLVVHYMDPVAFNWVLSKVGRKAGRMARLIAGPVEPLSPPTRSKRVASSARAQEAHHVHRHAGPSQASWALVSHREYPFPPLTQRLLRHRREFEVCLYGASGPKY